MPSSSTSQELSALMLKFYDAPLSDVSKSQLLKSSCLDKTLLLNSIPQPSSPSHRPLHLLHNLLSHSPEPWPTFELIKCYTRVLKYLPESAKIGSSENELSSLSEATARLVKDSYKSFADFLSDSPRPALRSTTSSKSFITHRGLQSFVTNFQLPVENSSPRKPIVAVALPNGPLLAATNIAVTTYYTAAPINPAAGAEQFQADVTQAGAKFILTTPDDYTKLEMEYWTRDSGIMVVFVNWDQGDGISLSNSNGQPLVCPESKQEPNKGDDVAIILFTSGTSGTKKVVPLLLHSIIAGIVFVIESWGLTETDVCLNMMPLYHVGGLVRNIFAPIFSGGSTVCCAAFDPNMFWDVVEELQPTWYYASPSMHSVILAEVTSRPQSLKKSRIRLACNAAGGLLPSLACQLRDTFDCIVLPSYGMTECMPISTPPLDYKLDREGTSGITTGPELTILDWSENQVSCGIVGRICVRGEPVFPGYLKSDGTFDKSPFNQNGWFDTGDLGYMDQDGYLYITGRSKEVINRGGELISPFEVENAILSAAMSQGTPISNRVSQVLAFSAQHNVLQEVVGVAIVTTPGAQRADLRAIHAAVRSSLQQVKWPVLVTYMDDLPKKNNKVLRIKLGERFGIPCINDDMPYLNRHWEARCPPPDTALQVAIPSSLCKIDFVSVSATLSRVVPSSMMHHYCEGFNEGGMSLFIAPTHRNTPPMSLKAMEDIKDEMSQALHNYMVPEQVHLMPEPFVMEPSGQINDIELMKSFNAMQAAAEEKLTASTQGKVTKAFADILCCSPDKIPQEVDFFALGGDSLRAGKLVALLRSTFNCALSINIVFNLGTVKAIAAHVDEIASENSGDDNYARMGCIETRSSTNPFLMALQLFPLLVMYPVRRALSWTIFIVGLAVTQTWWTNESVAGRLLNIILALSLSNVLMLLVMPFIGILTKWLVIGRYRQGMYPMWGLYHTRWWLVEKTLALCGLGFFKYTNFTLCLYYRLLGARIGKGVKLSGASLGEYDLLDIRDGTSLERCVCRPFAAESNTSMYLGQIIIGENSFVGVSSIVAAGSVIPPGTCIGANSSSWELQDTDESNHDLDSTNAPKPHWVLTLLFTLPLYLVQWFLARLPWMGGLLGMVLTKPKLADQTAIRAVLEWFVTPQRIAYHYFALCSKTLLAPFVLFLFTVLVKCLLDLVFGKLESSPESRSTVSIWRATLIKTLLPVGSLHQMTSLFGQHYEATSVAIRMLGGKVGQRVYWPGSGPSINDYHLLDIGNDVVFGSRAHLITSDAKVSEKITIRDGAMIADRVALLPGVDIGEQTVMGSGALTQRGKSYAPHSVFVGSKGGDAVCLSTGRDKLRDDRPRRRPLGYHSNSSNVALTEEKQILKKQQQTRGRHQRTNSEDTLLSAKSSNESETSPKRSSESSSTDVESSETSSTLSPFGRAFYLKQAPYHVMSLFAIFCYSTFITLFTAVYWDATTVSGSQLVNYLIQTAFPSDTEFWEDAVIVWLLGTAAIAALSLVQSILAMTLVIASKWALLGRRKVGNYDWDKSPYCQRWQLFLAIEKIRRSCFRGQGVLGMLTGTHWIVLYFKALGADIGKDCALFANGRPSLMFTEPDLIKLGDRVVVDDASVVAHINTRGKFDLNKLEIGDRCVLRTGSRLLSGAMMKDDSCLLEHTLIMGGDVVEAKWTMQGWPADKFSGERAKM